MPGKTDTSTSSITRREIVEPSCYKKQQKSPNQETGVGNSTMSDFFYETLQKKDSERCMFIV